MFFGLPGNASSSRALIFRHFGRAASAVPVMANLRCCRSTDFVSKGEGGSSARRCDGHNVSNTPTILPPPTPVQWLRNIRLDIWASGESLHLTVSIVTTFVGVASLFTQIQVHFPGISAARRAQYKSSLSSVVNVDHITPDLEEGEAAQSAATTPVLTTNAICTCSETSYRLPAIAVALRE
ncbi:hypothetical protein B0H34DRAFT_153950 [Crassisporium funariophilum]|nr:hypothetical protein B0H34DRAFT_153950 [Crassisporium funariophilum]